MKSLFDTCIIPLASLALAAIFIAGCGSSSSSSSTSSSTASTTTTLTSTSNSTTTGTSITLTASVSPSAATGTVTFYNGTTSLGTGTLSSGTATLTTSFSSAGTYTLTATYGGSSSYASSTSTAISVGVTTPSSSSGTPTSTSLSTASNTAYPYSLVALTATITANGNAVNSTSGTVTFSYTTSGNTTPTELTCSNTSSTMVAVNSSGAAVCATHFAGTGSYTVTAAFSGDSTYGSSASSSVSESVASGSYSLGLSSYSYTTGSTTVTTDTTHSVNYKLYENVIYAVNPVDATYESMDIFIPTSVDGNSASNQPILLDIGVGGYMSDSTWGQTSVSSTNGQYALGKGYVVVEVGCRGSNNGGSGDYYGVAPAAIMDLKAAVRFLRYNSSNGEFSGDVSHIIDAGGSAGGALASLLGASGNSPLYYSDAPGFSTAPPAYYGLAHLGAADADDNIFAVGAWSPITNLDHADAAYEMEYGSLKYSGSAVNQSASADLISAFDTYQNGLALTDKRGSYGTLTSSNITNFILTQYMEPSLEKYVETNGASSAPSYATCTANNSSTYGYTCTFTFANYLNNSIGARGKSEPAFDAFFDITSSSPYYSTAVNTTCPPETLEFGNPTGSTSSYSGSNCNAGSPRHFTSFSNEAMDGTAISSSMQTIVNMMNPMYFITNAIASGNSSGIAKYWYIRDGTIATDTSAYVIVDLATSLDDLLGTNYVNPWEDWNEGHAVNADPGGFSTWVTSAVATN